MTPGKRRPHFKSPPLQDLDVERFNQWPVENVAFYKDFRKWLSENGYSASALGIYGAAVRMALGYLRKPWQHIHPAQDIERVLEHLENSHRKPSTQADYAKGLKKLAEYLALRRHLPTREKPIPWSYTIGMLSPALQEDIRDFLRHCQHGWKLEQRFERSRDTLYGLGVPLRWMAEHAGVDEIEKLTPQVWYRWMDYRLLSEIKPSTLNSDLSGLKRLAQFLRETGRRVNERFLLVEPLDLGHPLHRDVALDNLRQLQGVIQAEAASGDRVGRMDWAWFLLMLHCGLRTCEVRQLKIKDIDWAEKRIRIEQSKGLKDRLVYLDETAVDALEDYLAVRGQEQYLPENVFIYRHMPLSRSYCFQKLETYGERCNVKASPHRLRHSCATLLLNAGAPVTSVQMILGHKQIDTTLGYARLYDGTVAADYHAAMNQVEQQLSLPEDRVKEPPSLGQLIALVDALRGGSLSPVQSELARTLREGLGLLETVKVREAITMAEILTNAEVV